ncbi:PepSY-associated TM helix domain-containing protein [Sphingomonas hengshuiensis]|uniref:Peptidase n=1 Tax=Sphingomonas hengshuiensis TaxID=1609977 RepID=A0A7U4J6I7_9SPHN|nr:PepSY domain-containing protein [Sphingomonas hengshuiensis]AJP71171.1 peptidase [Sphingomonas hengshuiensis]
MGARWYNTVWRWHFYAGLLCMPFILWLATTGTLYLWKPQIEALIERPYDGLAADGPRASAAAQVAAAVAAVPGSTLRRFQLPEDASQSTRITVTSAGVDRRVYVDPYRLRVLHIEREDSRLMRTVFLLHGTLLAGAPGSYLVEIAACWAVVMLLTGLFLWWPRGGAGLAGTLYPRRRRGKRVFWRDLHAVSGIWVAAAALVLISTGLPWAKFWGSYFLEVRKVTGTLDGPPDWTIGGKKVVLDEHAGHGGMASMPPPVPSGPAIDRVVARTYPLGLAAPVMILPPAAPGAPWSVLAQPANRPLAASLTIDGDSGAVTSRRDFAQRHWVDRVVGYGIALHEGALFGLVNQLLGTLTALLLATLSVSGAVMWWRRRPSGVLGAPPARSAPRAGALLLGTIATLAVAMPLFGLTLILALLVEGFVLRGWPAARKWLGLSSIAA